MPIQSPVDALGFRFKGEGQREREEEHLMRKAKDSYSQFLGMVVPLEIIISDALAKALEPEPHPLDTFLTAILNFREQTVIQGTLRYN